MVVISANAIRYRHASNVNGSAWVVPIFVPINPVDHRKTNRKGAASAKRTAVLRCFSAGISGTSSLNVPTAGPFG